MYFSFPQGEWKPKQIDNPNYKGEWVHPEIDNPEYQPDDSLYKYDDIGALGFDLWQVSKCWELAFSEFNDTYHFYCSKVVVIELFCQR